MVTALMRTLDQHTLLSNPQMSLDDLADSQEEQFTSIDQYMEQY